MDTIVAGNVGPGAPDCFPGLPTSGYNLIGNTFNCTSQAFLPTDKTNVNPKLFPLANNGGPTRTNALQSDSPAIDAGLPNCLGTNQTLLTTDQRGFPRTVDGNADAVAVCDIGAYELQAPDADGDGYTDAAEIALGENPNLYCPIMRADVDGDHVVSILDFVKVAAFYGQTIPPALARYNQDGDAVISILDFVKMAASYGKNVSACP